MLGFGQRSVLAPRRRFDDCLYRKSRPARHHGSLIVAETQHTLGHFERQPRWAFRNRRATNLPPVSPNDSWSRPPRGRGPLMEFQRYKPPVRCKPRQVWISGLLLNISPTMDIPGDHCDIPPKSEWRNCAMRPPLERSARRIVRTASGETECRIETRSMNPSSSNGMVSIQLSTGVCLQSIEATQCYTVWPQSGLPWVRCRRRKLNAATKAPFPPPRKSFDT